MRLNMGCETGGSVDFSGVDDIGCDIGIFGVNW